MIEFKNFTFQYRSLGTPTLKNINLSIQSGEKVLIAGPSGSGKSTLGHCLNGLIPFSYSGEITGELQINNIEPHKASIFDISSHVSTILQDQDGQFVGLSVGEDVAFREENSNVTVDIMKQNVKTALKKVNMENHICKSPQELSGGLKQRASLAGIIMSEAPILLFDEPLANLDPASGRSAMELISSVHEKSNKTIVVIEHRIEDVLAEKFDKIIIIDNGIIAASGTPAELILDGSLRRFGLREPLYIETLRHAGVDLKELDVLDIYSLNSPNVKENIDNWIENVKPKVLSYDEKILEIKDLTFSYNKKDNIIKNINFDLYKGEIISLLGNNGAGKSTLSKVITGICKNSKGTISYKGENIDSWSIRKRGQEIGYVMQNPNHMITQETLLDEVSFGLKLRGYKKDEILEKAENTLKICGLHAFRNWPITALSYGQKKRLSIATILALDPSILILDEPTAGQDYKHYLEFMQFIESLSKTGLSIIFITHDMHLALEYSNRAIVLSNGEIIRDDTVSSVLSHAEILEQANLKKISVSTLAGVLDIDEKLMLETFINYDHREMV
ncbi:ATP-binding cassette domain-containing protein [Psychrilyobacter piezotolerans]|uniref:ATP-binding cassette domain-containing protein n=1 Tax=Psychrilyobacter piezotolerans TaxID=2293438 RepID=A0ABX9KCT5_9FUSO|nr:ABC transporter ATP-binding protein [Psychrilyobacter piezotolerans]RDE58793.1 ATP-binding cassette domain-containing protein [Psychrilyobacter sp. S5]REI39271.1 ATP-binding cassette domain-containing protein [Psychrilyobacter piezotolerans]